MNSLLPFIVVGLATGAVYGLAGVGLVLTYRTSGVFNFAHGAVASAGAYSFYELHNKHGVPWPVAVAICILLMAPAMGVGLELIGRQLAGQSAALRVVATVGLLLILLGLAFGVKYQGGLYAAALLPLVVVISRRNARRPSDMWVALARFGALGALCAAPWLLKNGILFHAPLYPFLSRQAPADAWLASFPTGPTAIGTVDSIPAERRKARRSTISGGNAMRNEHSRMPFRR